MAIPIIDSIINFISGPIDTVLKKKLKDKNKEMELKHEIEMAILKAPVQQLELFEKRVLAEIENPNWFRDAVRPVVTYTCWALYCYVKIVTVYVVTKVYLPLLTKMTESSSENILFHLPRIKEILAEFIASIFTIYDLYIMLTILGFWFGSKLLERTIDKITKTGGIASVFMGLKEGIAGTIKKDNGKTA
jgi:hypothetical protein